MFLRNQFLKTELIKSAFSPLFHQFAKDVHEVLSLFSKKVHPLTSIHFKGNIWIMDLMDIFSKSIGVLE